MIIAESWSWDHIAYHCWMFLSVCKWFYKFFPLVCLLFFFCYLQNMTLWRISSFSFHIWRCRETHCLSNLHYLSFFQILNNSFPIGITEGSTRSLSIIIQVFQLYTDLKTILFLFFVANGFWKFTYRAVQRRK